MNETMEQVNNTEDRVLSVKQIGRNMATGGMFLILGQLIVLPVNLIAMAFLARVLGPADFGFYSVAMSIILVARMIISMLFNRASIKLIAETSEWEPLAIALIQIQLYLGIAAGVATFLAAPALAKGLGNPASTPAVRVFAVVIPISSLAQAYKNTLDGRRAFRRSAILPLVSDVSRLMLVLVLVGIGYGMTGAALAILGATFVELWFARRSLSLRVRQKVSIPFKHFLEYSLPLFLDATAKQFRNRIDLWAVQILAGTVSAGFYSVALSFNATHRIFTQTLTTLILSSVSDPWSQGQRDAARTIIHQILRLTLWLLPFAALGSGAAPALITLIFGKAYSQAIPLLVWVSFSIVALVIVSTMTSIFAAIGRPGAAFMFNGPLLILALIGYLIFVPRFGALGAAITTTVTTWGVAVATIVAIRHWCQVSLGRDSIARIILTTIIAFTLSSAWHAPGAWIIPQLFVLCGVVLFLLFVLGEVTKRDLDFALSLLKVNHNTQDMGGK